MIPLTSLPSSPAVHHTASHAASASATASPSNNKTFSTPSSKTTTSAPSTRSPASDLSDPARINAKVLCVLSAARSRPHARLLTRAGIWVCEWRVRVCGDVLLGVPPSHPCPPCPPGQSLSDWEWVQAIMRGIGHGLSHHRKPYSQVRWARSAAAALDKGLTPTGERTCIFNHFMYSSFMSGLLQMAEAERDTTWAPRHDLIAIDAAIASINNMSVKCAVITMRLSGMHFTELQRLQAQDYVLLDDSRIIFRIRSHKTHGRRKGKGTPPIFRQPLKDADLHAWLLHCEPAKRKAVIWPKHVHAAIVAWWKPFGGVRVARQAIIQHIASNIGEAAACQTVHHATVDMTRYYLGATFSKEEASIAQTAQRHCPPTA